MSEGPSAGTADWSALRLALERFDEAEAQHIFDRVLSLSPLEGLLADVVLPYLRDLGERWERFEVSIAQEHFASGILRERLLALTRGWSGGQGPQALLACPPKEHHDIGLITFGLALRERGWRIHFLGANIPVASVREAASSLDADLVVFSGAMPHTLYAVAGEIVHLGRDHAVAVGGVAAAAFRAAGERLIVLDGHAVEEARAVTEKLGPQSPTTP